MKFTNMMNPKRLFRSKKNSPSSISRSGSPSFSSTSDGSTTHRSPTTVLPQSHGYVSIQHLESLLTRLGPVPPTQEELTIMLREVDHDGRGCVSVDALVDRVGSGCDPDELRDVFRVFDTDRDGKISAEELLRVFQAIGEERCTLDECRRMIESVDRNGDGFVCFDDFSRMMDLHR